MYPSDPLTEDVQPKRLFAKLDKDMFRGTISLDVLRARELFSQLAANNPPQGTSEFVGFEIWGLSGVFQKLRRIPEVAALKVDVDSLFEKVTDVEDEENEPCVQLIARSQTVPLAAFLDAIENGNVMVFTNKFLSRQDDPVVLGPVPFGTIQRTS